MEAIYLVGSRGKIPQENWDTLEGKDWDVIFQTKLQVNNTRVWTSDLNYHIDLLVFKSYTDN